MAITIAGRGKSGTLTTDPADLASVVVASGEALYVGVVWNGTATIVGATWNGSESMTQIATKNATAGDIKTVLFELLNPTPTTATISIDFSAAPGSAQIHYFRVLGSNRVSGARSPFTRNDANGAGPGLTITNSVANDLILHIATVFATTITWAGDETTTNTTANNIGGNSYSGGGSTKLAAGANETVDCTDVSLYGEIGVAIPEEVGILVPRHQIVRTFDDTLMRQ